MRPNASKAHRDDPGLARRAGLMRHGIGAGAAG